jgi:F-type H+-transporting ATPase subunit alpha
VVEVLKQGQFSPMPVEDQVVAIFAVTEGHMDDVPIADVPDFEAALIDFVGNRYSGLVAEIRDTGRLPEDELVAAITAFKAERSDSRE